MNVFMQNYAKKANYDYTDNATYAYICICSYVWHGRMCVSVSLGW